MCDYLAQLAIKGGRQPDTMCCDKPLCNINPYSQKTNASTISMFIIMLIVIKEIYKTDLSGSFHYIIVAALFLS